ncbi:MAG: HEAT repeat domain-containing protein [Candidatus Competibacteraceae bacterium]|nr:HEAT repeat domain-containing protein [Candidatus Competibacteraceae bacterium]
MALRLKALHLDMTARMLAKMLDKNLAKMLDKKLGAEKWGPMPVELPLDHNYWFNPPTMKDYLYAWKLDVEEQIPKLTLTQSLRHSDQLVRQAAAEARGKLVAKEQVPELFKLLGDSEEHVRATAALALGELGAEEQAPELAKLLRDPDWSVIQAVAEALGKLVAKEQVPELVKLLGDSEEYVRATAALALGGLGAKEQALELAKLLRDSERYFHRVAAWALGAMGPHDLRIISSILPIVYDDSSRTVEIRFWAHFLGGGDPAIEIILAWLAEPITRPTTAIGQDHDLAVKTLHVFEQAWPLSEPFPKLRHDLERQIAAVAKTGQWKTDDLPLLKTHATNLEVFDSTHAAAVRQTIASLETSDHALTIAKVAVGHVVFWLALITVYPRSRIVQAIFFWNPWVRRFTGLGYVGFALTWVPFLRTKLFAPFKPSLIADAALDTFDEAAYFPDSAVKEKASGRQQPLREAIPAIRGQIVLEGESGIGKTMFLRSLVKRARRVVVYLPAKKCVGGVLEAIQAKLHGPAQDPAFLRNLIYSGALDICIDGLNEVSADARAKITEFVESYFKGNILMSTQPLEWTPPATAKIYILEPLAESQIENFLLSRKNSLPDDAQLVGDAYEQTCRHYLTATLDPQQSPEALAAMRQLLSNPMDLTLVAAMLARGETPDIFHLQEQQYRIMAKDYRRTQLHEFPLPQFAEAVYQIRLKDEDTLPVGEFADELQSMERHKMTVSRSLDEGGKSCPEWHFRHDKIADFFVVQAFLGPDNDKPEKHLGDARFRGVYLQLARLLPLNAARALERQLIDYAADTQDHTVSDTFIQLLRSRQDECSPEVH